MPMDAETSSKEAKESGPANENVIKSKRRRFQDDDDDDGTTHVVDNDVKELLAKELSDYLDRLTIEEVVMCEKDDEERNTEEEQEDDFRLFSNSEKMASETFSKEIQGDNRASSSSEDDDEATARLKEAAVSMEDIFGSKLNENYSDLESLHSIVYRN